MSTMVGLGTDECRQKRVVNINDLVRERPTKVIGNNLHVASKNHQVHVKIFLQQFQLLLFLFFLCVLGDWEYLKAVQNNHETWVKKTKRVTFALSVVNGTTKGAIATTTRDVRKETQLTEYQMYLLLA
jgi:hypothetical protein